MRILKVVILTIGIICLRRDNATAQIPEQGSDIPSLTGFHWGMTMQEVRDYLHGKRKLKNTTSSILSYKDTLLNVEAEVYLKFAEKNTLLILNSIEVPLDSDNESLQEIGKYFIKRYGNNYQSWKVHKGLDGERKAWQLKSERVELEALMNKEKIVCLYISYIAPKVKRNSIKAPIPVKGCDFPTLRDLQWGMTIQAAKKSITGKKEISDITSSEFSYEDTLLDTKAKMNLKFDDCDSLVLLYAIHAEIMVPNKELLQSMEKIMIDRYGNNYTTYKDSKSKFFFTMYLEAKTWRFTHESIRLATMSHGDEVKNIKVLYEFDDSKQ